MGGYNKLGVASGGLLLYLRASQTTLGMSIAWELAADSAGGRGDSSSIVVSGLRLPVHGPHLEG